ncbi:hypothetical protein AZE42_06638, partial [Rhizopogon vesiculosus]
MTLFTRNASKKRKLEPSSSPEVQDSGKVPQKRTRMRQDQDAHEQPAGPRNPTYLEARILPMASTPTLPLTATSSSTTPMVSTSKPLRGHKRFNADLRELKTGCLSDLDRGVWSVQSFRAGDDDGSVEFELVDSTDQTRIVVHLLCSDISEYPNTHSFFCYSPNPGNHVEQMKTICDEVLNSCPSTIHEVAKQFLVKFSSDDDDDNDEDDEDDIGVVSIKPEVSRSILRRDFEGAYAAGYIPGIIWTGNCEFLLTISLPVVELTGKIPAHALMFWDSQFLLPVSRSILRRDFEGAYAAGYTPGIIWTGNCEFFLTISLPVVELTEKIPAHALMSWDSQFLIPGQHLVLAISGFRGVYPPILNDGTPTAAASWSGASLKFNVGFSQRYKPSKEHVSTSLRQYGLQFNQSDLTEEYIDVEGGSDN